MLQRIDRYCIYHNETDTELYSYDFLESMMILYELQEQDPKWHMYTQVYYQEFDEDRS